MIQFIKVTIPKYGKYFLNIDKIIGITPRNKTDDGTKCNAEVEINSLDGFIFTEETAEEILGKIREVQGRALRGQYYIQRAIDHDGAGI